MEGLIKIGSLTVASRARRSLLEYGIRTRLTRTETTKEGCLWGLRVARKDILAASTYLRRMGVVHELH